MAISLSARQRLTSGLWGGRLAGSFEGKTETEPEPEVSVLRGRLRRGRRPLWLETDAGTKLQPEALKDEPAYIAQLATEADLHALIDERRVLAEALEFATARQRKAISAMVQTIERRVAEIEDDHAAIVLLM